MAGFYGALVEAINIAEVQHDDDDDLFPYFSMQRDRIAGIIRELAESEKGRAGVDVAGALLGAFLLVIARSDVIASLGLAKTILKLSKSVEGRAGLVAAGGCGALSQALRIDQGDFEMFSFDCLEDFWELERCNESALRKLRNNKK